MSQNNFLNKKTKRDEKMKKDEKKENNNLNQEKYNFIIGNIEIMKYKSRQRIINSNKNNEEEIKECEIYINDK